MNFQMLVLKKVRRHIGNNGFVFFMLLTSCSSFIHSSFLCYGSMFISCIRSFNESAWGGTFDNNDDVDSVWGIKPVNTKVSLDILCCLAGFDRCRYLFGFSIFFLMRLFGFTIGNCFFKRKDLEYNH